MQAFLRMAFQNQPTNQPATGKRVDRTILRAGPGGFNLAHFSA